MARFGHRYCAAAFGLLGALALAQAYAHAAEPSEATAIAAQRSLEVLPSGHPVVLVALDNSAPKRFVVDTAASITTIMPQLRAQMPDLIAKASNEPLQGAAGSTGVETTRIDRLHVAGRTFRSRELMLLPPGPTDRLGVDGILGADIIASFVVAMDMPGRTWRMTDKVESGMLDGLTASVPFVLDRERAPRLTITINGVAVPAVLDTGARGTIINWAAAKAVGISPNDPGLAKGTDIKGATSHATASVEASLKELAIGDAKVAAPRVRIADLSVFKALGFTPDQPAVILGIDMLADRRFVIDHPGLRLHISPPLPRPAAAQN
jgi:predicted aspartyl protease